MLPADCSAAFRAAEREVALHYTLEDFELDRKLIEKLPS
jgi:hypothetical protein